MMQTYNFEKNQKNRNSESDENEIDLLEIILEIWNNKWFIIVTSVIFAVASAIYAINLPNIYQSEILLAPSKQDSNDQLSSLAGKFSGLASMAGINLSDGKAGKTQLAVEVLKSRKFISTFIQKHKILPELFAAKSWDSRLNILKYDENIYDVKHHKWTRKVNLPFVAKPSMQEAYIIFMKNLSIKTEKDTGFTTLSVKNISPYLAQQWATLLVTDINETMKKRDVIEAEKGTIFLNDQIKKTNISDIKTVLYKLIEEQTKIIMFAHVRQEYVFKIIDPAIVSELRFEPNRAFISIIGTLVGGFIAVMIVLFRFLIKK